MYKYKFVFQYNGIMCDAIEEIVEYEEEPTEEELEQDFTEWAHDKFDGWYDKVE